MDAAVARRDDLQRREPEAPLPAQAAALLSLQSTAGNCAVAHMVQRWRESPAAPSIQRKAKITWKGQSFESAADSDKAELALTEALDTPKTKHLLDLLPTELRRPREILARLFEAKTNYGTFTLPAEVQKLIGVIVQTHRAGTAARDTTKVDKGITIKNDFQVEKKSKQEIQQTLSVWNAYYQYKTAQYKALRDVNPDYHKELSAKVAFKNFANVGSLIDLVTESISKVDDKNIHQTVRVLINPKFPDRIAAILIFRSTPTGKRPGYVADLLANPKSIKPDRKEVDFKTHKGGITDDALKGQGRAALPDASTQKGGGNVVLQHAVLESGPEGIKLAPLNETTEATYRAMNFGGATFQPADNGHLVLKPADMDKFAKDAKAAGLKETIEEWRKRWG